MITTFDETITMSRLWGASWSACSSVLWFLGIAVGFLGLVTWIPVLLNGRYPDWGYRIVGGYTRWQNRTSCYALLMTGPYPPFSLDD